MSGWNHRRFLTARRNNIKDAKKMFTDCQHWRKTVEGVGIDELYRRIDPFDVSGMRRCKPSWIVAHLGVCRLPTVKRLLNTGQCGSTRYFLWVSSSIVEASAAQLTLLSPRRIRQDVQ